MRIVNDWPERVTWICETYAKGNDQAMADELSKVMPKTGAKKPSRQLVQSWRTGKQGATLDYLTAIVQAFPKVHPHWLLTGVGPRTRPVGEKDPRLETAADLRNRIAQLAEEVGIEYGIAPEPGAELAKDMPGTQREPPTS
jgi:hypothetical protein